MGDEIYEERVARWRATVHEWADIIARAIVDENGHNLLLKADVELDDRGRIHRLLYIEPVSTAVRSR